MAIRIGKTQNGESLLNYFKVWKITEHNGFIKAQCSTGRKKSKDSTDYINSSWNLKFVGNCSGKAQYIKEGDKLIVSECQIENSPDANKKYWLNVTVFAFEIEGQSAPSGDGFTPVDEQDLGGLPF